MSIQVTPPPERDFPAGRLSYERSSSCPRSSQPPDRR